MNLFAYTANNHWAPGIGDPSLMGWVTVVAYFVGALLCWKAAAKAAAIERTRVPAAPPPSSFRRGGAKLFWGVLGLMLAFLGVNKQLDLQTWLTFFVKGLAQNGGWYEQRRPVQAAFVIVIALAGLASLAGLKHWVGKTTRPMRVALAGAIFLGCFVIIRASSFHHVDQMLGMKLEGFKLNWLLELGGIGCIASAALSALRSRPVPGQDGPNFIWVTAGDR
jgi:hypothetical protein